MAVARQRVALWQAAEKPFENASGCPCIPLSHQKVFAAAKLTIDSTVNYGKRLMNAGKKTSTAKGEATRIKLLAAAEREFGGRGFHAASVSSITRRAKVAQGTFYFYFEGKEEIFTTLVREIGNSLRQRMAQAITAVASTNRIDADRRGLKAFLEFAAEHPGLYRIVQEAQFVDAQTHREYYERVAQGYARSLSTASQAGELHAGDAEMRAWAIMGIGHFLGLRYCLWQRSKPDEAVLDQVMDFIAHGMACRAGRQGRP